MSRGIVWSCAVILLFASWSRAQGAGRDQPFFVSDSLQDAREVSAKWDVGFGFEPTAKGLEHRMQMRQFAFPSDAPWGKSVSAEAIVKITRAVGQEWKLAGVAIHLDDQNFWQLTLCEAPDAKGAQHYVDFHEMRQGTWQSQVTDKLPLVAYPGTGGEWRYDQSYRLRLEMTSQAIVGTVEDEIGRAMWKQAYRFDGPAVRSGRPALASGACASLFSGFRGRVADLVPGPNTDRQYPRFLRKGTSVYNGTKTGFFHVEKDGDVWWLVDPAGAGSFFLSVDHVNYNAGWCEALGYSQYQKNSRATYGSEEKWSEETRRRLAEWGFNGIGAGSGESLEHSGLVHTRFLNLGQDFCTLGDEYRITYPDDGKPKPCSYFPNVFHPRFAEFCKQQTRRLCAANLNDPWLLGYFLDNELAWWGRNWGERYGLFDECMRKTGEHAAKQALITWLKGRYSSADVLAKAWGIPLVSFDELGAMTSISGKNRGAIDRDRREFVRMLAERYFQQTTAAIRAADPNHMVLGCRFAGATNGSYENAWAAAGKFCDIVSINVYEKVDLKTGEVYTGEGERRLPLRSVMADVNQKCGGKPMMVTEWSFPAYDSGLPCKHGAGQRVDTQAQRAFCFETFQKFLFASPYMVGSSYFMWLDDPAQGIAPWFPEDSNYGLVDVNGKPYELLTQTAARINAQAADLHAAASAK